MITAACSKKLDLSVCRAAGERKLDCRKINRGVRRFVEIICENVERDIGDNFRDFAARKTGILYDFQIGIARLSAINKQSAGEFQSRV